MSRKYIYIIFALLFSFQLRAQVNEVSLVVTGEGANKEEATQNALRSAVEQAFGVFVSANTEVLNDEIIREEVATISSGNIKSFREIAYNEPPEGQRMITIEATVSVGQLVSYFQAHNITTELAGASIAANMKIYELNERSTLTALKNIYTQLIKLAPRMYDYVIKSATPSVNTESSTVLFDLDIDIIANANTSSIGEFFVQSLQALAKTREEITPYLKMGYTGTAIVIKQFEGRDLKPVELKMLTAGAPLFGAREKKKDAFFLYSPISFKVFQNVFSRALFDLRVTDNHSLEYEVYLPDWEGRNQKERLMKKFVFENYTSVKGTKNSFCRISPPLTGVYDIIAEERPYSGGYRDPNGLNQVLSTKLPDNCVANTAIVLSKFKSGDLVYSLKGRIMVNRENVNTITEFSAHPLIEDELNMAASTRY